MDRLLKLAGVADGAAESKAAQRLKWWLRALVAVGIVGWLVYQLYHIGWAEVWAARPRTPWFYILWIALYFQLPVAEGLIHRMVWGLPLRELGSPLLRKRALNQDVVSYSGEVFFFVWLRKRLRLPRRRILGALKDNMIASVLASWTSTTLFVGAFLFTGQLPLLSVITEREVLMVLVAAALALALIAVGVRFRRRILTLPTRTAVAAFGIHLSRLVLVAGLLQILQWWLVLPQAPLSVWATIFVVLSLINRLPLLPARDLIGISTVLGLSSYLAAPASAIAALLLTRSVLDKLANSAFFVAGLVMERGDKPADFEAPEIQTPEEPLPNPATVVGQNA